MKMENLHQTELGFLFLVYLDGFQFFSLHLTPDHGEGYYLEGIKYLSLIQYLLKICTSSLSSDTTFSISVNVILSSCSCGIYHIVLWRCTSLHILIFSELNIKLAQNQTLELVVKCPQKIPVRVQMVLQWIEKNYFINVLFTLSIFTNNLNKNENIYFILEKTEAYLELSHTSKMEPFCENS